MEKRQIILNWLERNLPKTFLQFTILHVRNSASGGIMGFKIIQTKSVKDYYHRRFSSRCYDLAARYSPEDALQKAIEEIFTHPNFVNQISQHLPSINNIERTGRYKLFDLEVSVDFARWDLQVITRMKNLRS